MNIAGISILDLYGTLNCLIELTVGEKMFIETRLVVRIEGGRAIEIVTSLERAKWLVDFTSFDIMLKKGLTGHIVDAKLKREEARKILEEAKDFGLLHHI